MQSLDHEFVDCGLRGGGGINLIVIVNPSPTQRGLPKGPPLPHHPFFPLQSKPSCQSALNGVTGWRGVSRVSAVAGVWQAAGGKVCRSKTVAGRWGGTSLPSQSGRLPSLKCMPASCLCSCLPFPKGCDMAFFESAPILKTQRIGRTSSAAAAAASLLALFAGFCLGAFAGPDTRVSFAVAPSLPTAPSALDPNFGSLSAPRLRLPRPNAPSTHPLAHAVVRQDSTALMPSLWQYGVPTPPPVQSTRSPLTSLWRRLFNANALIVFCAVGVVLKIMYLFGSQRRPSHRTAPSLTHDSLWHAVPMAMAGVAGDMDQEPTGTPPPPTTRTCFRTDNNFCPNNT